MLYDNLRRGLSLALALVMVFTLMPFSALATETEPVTEPSVEAEPVNSTTAVSESVSEPTGETEPDANALMLELQQEMDKILMTYLNATVLTEDEVIDIVNTMYWDDMEKAVAECDALEPMFSALSEEELAQLETTYAGADTIICFYETMQLAMTPTLFADGSYTPVTNVSVDVSNATSTSESDGAITVTAKGSYVLFQGYNARTTTITISNSSTTDKATVSFDWTATSVNSLVIDGSSYTGTGGSFSKLLDPGDNFTVTITTAKNSTTNTLVMKNFAWVKAADTSKVKFDYDSLLGSITVDGAAVADEGEKDIPLAGAALVAKPNSGTTFLGWIDGNNKILSTAASFTLIPTADMTAKAVFIKTTSTDPWFRVGTDYLFDDLNAADEFAKTATNRLITLLRSGTLPSGKDYTISSGNSFLIPCSDTDIGVFGGLPATVASGAGASEAFRTLTIPDGVQLTVEGSMSVNAAQDTPGAGDTGQVYGKYGRVVLDGSNAKITVSGSLTCYGYITGTGTVHATSTAKVYELFQLRDWRGGTTTLAWYNQGIFGADPKTNSFIVNEYYIQNIETKYRVDAGALSYISAAMNMALVGVQQAQAVYIGSGGLFQLGANSYLIREYKASEDRIYYDLYGTVTTEGIDLQVSTYELNTSEFILSIPHSMTITIKGKDPNGNTINSKATVTKPFKLLPGAELIVEKNGTLEVASGTTLYLYDLYDWVKDGTFAKSYIYFAHLTEGEAGFKLAQTVKYTPSTKGTRKEQKSAALHIDGTLIGYSNIFTTADGSTQQDKVITGAGTFTNNAAASGYEQIALDEMKNNSADDIVTIQTVPVVGLLAGISTDETDVDDSFGTGTYYGLSSNYWYQYIINVSDESTPDASTVAGYITRTSQPVTMASTPETYNGYTGTNVVGYVANSKDANGTFAFKLNGAVESLSASGGTVTPTEGTIGTEYSLTGAAGDITMTIVTDDTPQTSYLTGWRSQIGLIEPWFLRINVVIVNSDHTQIDYSTLTDYGYYFIRASHLASEGRPTAEEIISNEQAVHYGKESVKTQVGEDGYTYFYADYNKGIYTYEMSESIYAVFYFAENNGSRQYTVVTEYNLKTLLGERKGDIDKFGALECAVYEQMYALEEDITEYRVGKTDSVTTMGQLLTDGMLGSPNTDVTYKFGVRNQIVLIEPWGLQVNAAIVPSDATSVAEHVDYESVDDYGVVMYYDVTGSITDAAQLDAPEEMLKLTDKAYVFSKSNGSAFINPGNDSYIAARYNKDVYTYQLNTNVYAVYFVKIDGNYYYSNVRTYNVRDLAKERGNDSSFSDQLERDVYLDMVNLYEAITAYREDYFSKNS